MLPKLVAVLVRFRLVTGMVMVVGTMVSSVHVVVDVTISAMGMVVQVLMDVFVTVGVCMFVRVDRVPVGMLMAVGMGVLVSMQVSMLMLTLHLRPPFIEVLGPSWAY